MQMIDSSCGQSLQAGSSPALPTISPSDKSSGVFSPNFKPRMIPFVGASFGTIHRERKYLKKEGALALCNNIAIIA